jgi:8-oxo-dGTP pyrophosphatase MutT (NUDIX family)
MDKYVAAGIIPLTKDGKVLIGLEKRGKQFVWGLLGGRRDSDEHESSETAKREFIEESNYIYENMNFDNFYQNPSIFLSMEKYMIYTIIVEHMNINALLKPCTNPNFNRKDACEMTTFEWIDFEDLVKWANNDIKPSYIKDYKLFIILKRAMTNTAFINNIRKFIFNFESTL